MAMRPARKPCTSCLCNLLALLDVLAGRDEQELVMTVKRRQATTMVDDDGISISSEPSGCRYRSGLRSVNWCSIINAKIRSAVVFFRSQDGVDAPALRTGDNHRLTNRRNHRPFPRTIALIHLLRVFDRGKCHGWQPCCDQAGHQNDDEPFPYHDVPPHKTRMKIGLVIHLVTMLNYHSSNRHHEKEG